MNTENSTSFTPGPWEISNAGSGSIIYIFGGKNPAQKGIVAHAIATKQYDPMTPDSNISKEEAAANARLIAAAPEMYKTLESIKSRLLDFEQKAELNFKDKEIIIDITCGLMLALTKIKGE